jgi:hypothetical protein
MASYILTGALLCGVVFLGLVTKRQTPLAGIALLFLVIVLPAFFYLLT